MDVLLEIFLGGVVSGLSYLASRNLASSCKFFDAFGVSFALSFSEVDVFFLSAVRLGIHFENSSLDVINSSQNRCP